MIIFIDEHLGDHGIESICKVLAIAPSTYHDHVVKRHDPFRLSSRARNYEALKPEIVRVFKENFEVYGVRKVWRQLMRKGRDVARCAVERLMQSMRLHGVIRGKHLRTTFSNKAASCPLDHVNQKFHALAPNRLWVLDLTCLSAWSGFVCIAFAIDVYARDLAPVT